MCFNQSIDKLPSELIELRIGYILDIKECLKNYKYECCNFDHHTYHLPSKLQILHMHIQKSLRISSLPRSIII